MHLNLAAKKQIVADVTERVNSAHSIIGAEYSGLTVEEMTELRVKAREAGVHLQVVRNTLARLAVADTDYSDLGDHLVGPLLLAFSSEDPGSAARIISEFRKDHEKLVVRIVSIAGKVLEPSDVETLAKLPTRDEAIAMLMGVMKAPISKFVRTLAEPHSKLVRTFGAVRESKQ